MQTIYIAYNKSSFFQYLKYMIFAVEYSIYEIKRWYIAKKNATTKKLVLKGSNETFMLQRKT